MKIPFIPSHCGPSRAFKRDRRRALKKAIAVMENVYAGCAYMPAYEEIMKIQGLFEIANEKCSAKNWGR